MKCGQKVFSKTGGKKVGALGGATPFNLTLLSLALGLVCVHLKRLEIGAKLGSKDLVKNLLKSHKSLGQEMSFVKECGSAAEPAATQPHYPHC